MQKIKYVLVLLFSGCFVSGFSQETDSPGSLSLRGNLDEQFDFVFQKSNSYQEYRVVRKDYLLHLKKSSTDSLKKYKTELGEFKTKINVQQAEKDTLQHRLDRTNTSLEAMKVERNNISLFGVQVSKSAYNSLMIGIIGVLVFLLTILLIRFKSSYRLSKESESNYLKLESDFEEFKRKAMEKEQQLGRKLQDEINKQKKKEK
ncbi:MAG: tRNA (guanine-N1)-methyltransferase [Flavobacteriaceae bacterium]|jgi:preprotein translocase subunit SecF|nr:tRNA (guanine-N1)-methyltransferase [Flavobacteriaceae bacterium]